MHSTYSTTLYVVLIICTLVLYILSGNLYKLTEGKSKSDKINIGICSVATFIIAAVLTWSLYVS